MNTQRICQRCRGPLAADAPQGVCPSCLLTLALGDPSEAPTLTASHIESDPGIQSPAQPPRPGEDFGPYRILRVLGRGGMGEVFEAEHAMSGRRVALKVMNHALASEADRKRFLREGRLAASVSHPNAVYIFGSEEIRGTPVIAMELVAGGTLKDRIKRSGPIPATEAVEAILHVIDGLEAAHDAGVLHRDIKPANCFVTADGAVKVGDFGLSISTLARGESLLTASGSVLGTPAYASPEQLRGEDLDVASDIYSVGATLFHLLTGRPPYETTDFVRLITEVLDKTPPAPDKLRPEIPAGLSKVVLRSLAKNRSARFSTYAAFRNALLPFISAAPAPAVLGARFVAGAVDELIGWLPSVVWLVVTGTDTFDSVISERTWHAVLIAGWIYAFYLLYYVVPEGLWGASLGKALCGLRVTGPNRHAPGMRRAFLRVLVFSSPVVIGVLGAMLIHTSSDFTQRLQGDGMTAYFPVWLILTILLWVTLRRRNGFAGVHDLISRTRVVARRSAHERPRLAAANSPTAPTPTRPALSSATPASTAIEQIGPYEVVRPLVPCGMGELLLGRDPVLRRFVWIRRLPAGTPPLPARRRDLSRPGRLRWLNGHRDSGQAWDAYESPDGMPLRGLLGTPQSWAAVRFWIDDLVQEFAAGNRTDTDGPVLATDRIWITGAGRALLLDFPHRADDLERRDPEQAKQGNPAKPNSQNSASSEDFSTVQRFLHRLAVDAMGIGSCSIAPRLPLHVQPFLQHLAEARFETPEYLLGNMGSLLDKPPLVTRQRRAAALVFGPAFALLFSLVMGGLLHFSHMRSTREWPEAQFPGSSELRGELRILDWILVEDGTRKAFKIHMASHHSDIVRDPKFWAHPKVKDTLRADSRRLAEEAVGDYADAGASRRAEAERIVAASSRSIPQTERLVGYYVGFSLFWIVLTAIAIVDLLCCLIVGHDFLLHLLGIATVRRHGGPAGRLVVLWRNAVAWGFCYLALPASVVWWSLLATVPPSIPITVAIGFVLPAIVVAGTAYAVWRPGRGLQDRLAGTHLVPR